MAKRRIKRSTNTPSKRRQRQLFSQKMGANGPLYRVSASKVTNKEVKWMAATINRRLAALEKAGRTEVSNEYQIIDKYANGEPKKKGSIYHVNKQKGTIRITSDTRKMSAEERAYLVTVMRNIMKAKTSTVKGTKQSRTKAWHTFLEKAKLSESQMPFNKYDEMWKLFRINVDPDRKDRVASHTVITILREQNFYDLTLDQMDESFQYMATLKDKTEWLDSPFGTGKIKMEYT